MISQPARHLYLKLVMLVVAPIVLTILAAIPNYYIRIVLGMAALLVALIVLVKNLSMAPPKLMLGITLLFPVMVVAGMANSFPELYEHANVSLLDQQNSESTPAHFLGTDQKGRDILVSSIAASSQSYNISIVCTFAGVLLGVMFGAAMSARNVVLRMLGGFVVELFEIFPWLFLTILVVGMMSIRSQALHVNLSSTTRMFIVATSVGLACMPLIARVTERNIDSLYGHEFVRALRGSSVSKSKIFFYNIIWNNVFPQIIVQTSFLFGFSLIMDSSLDFVMQIGFGEYGKSGFLSWGTLLADSRHAAIFGNHMWALAVPSGAIISTILGANLVGEGLAEFHHIKG